jgi:hypothetical protein
VHVFVVCERNECKQVAGSCFKKQKKKKKKKKKKSGDVVPWRSFPSAPIPPPR